EKEGKRAIYVGIENGYPIGNDLSNVEEYYDKGVRYITLVHSSNNDLADSGELLLGQLRELRSVV
ncbi:MAG: membrane dipeptidase, partial [Verrucomicrobiota bacterium]